jgi:AraC-like DNA-binding protein
VVTVASLTRGSALRHYADLVSSLGGAPESLLRARGINPATAGDFDKFIPYEAIAAVISDAALSLDCPDFGLRLARLQGIQILVPGAVIIRHSETVADAVGGVTRFLQNLVPNDETGLVRGPRVSALTLTIHVRNLAHRMQLVERGLGVAMDAFRLMLDENFVPLRVTMQHRRIGPVESYQDTFGCPVQFESALNAVYLPSTALDQKIRGRDAEALALAENYLSGIRPDLAVADHVREVTLRLLVINQASLVSVARALALHPRALQRGLAESGTTFEQILDDVRRGQAWEMSAAGMQLSQIATMLGYSEQSSYTRACQRWYGESPRQLRARRRAATSARPGADTPELDPALANHPEAS